MQKAPDAEWPSKCLHEAMEVTSHIAVQGAGTKIVNGFYSRDGVDLNGRPVWKHASESIWLRRGAADEATTDEWKFWMFVGGREATSRDNIFYSSQELSLIHI